MNQNMTYGKLALQEENNFNDFQDSLFCLEVIPSPSQSQHYYAVTAVDAYGNESAPSNCPFLDFQLLPVATINVTQTDSSYPVITWTYNAPSAVAGYNVYLGSGTSRIALNGSLITSQSFTDIGWTGSDRVYTVTAVDPQRF